MTKYTTHTQAVRVRDGWPVRGHGIMGRAIDIPAQNTQHHAPGLSLTIAQPSSAESFVNMLKMTLFDGYLAFDNNGIIVTIYFLINVSPDYS